MKCFFLAAASAAVLARAFPVAPAEPIATPRPTDCDDDLRDEVDLTQRSQHTRNLADTRQFDSSKPFPLLPQFFSPIGEINGTKYGGFYAQTANGQTQGLNAADDDDDKNVAAANLLSDIIQFGKLTIQPFGTISLNSSYESFNFFGLNLGCKTSASSLTGSAKSCNILVTGYKLGGAQLPTVTLKYTANGPKSQDLIRFSNLNGDFPDEYSDIISMTLGVASGSGLGTDTTIYIDDVSYSKNCHPRPSPSPAAEQAYLMMARTIVAFGVTGRERAPMRPWGPRV
ncbi:hypothetical protein LTR15_006453 [Elasticomyces elasticus]|nr:hypothetical protein LTR15_006453 [Elasticomyces elasticus]